MAYTEPLFCGGCWTIDKLLSQMIHRLTEVGQHYGLWSFLPEELFATTARCDIEWLRAR